MAGEFLKIDQFNPKYAIGFLIGVETPRKSDLWMNKVEFRYGEVRNGNN
jgi:hypothetical protein